MKKLFAKLTGNKEKAYQKSIDYDKLNRNITVIKDNLEDKNLTMCQRQEFEKALEHLEKYQK